MRMVRRVTPDMLPLPGMISDQALIGEAALLKIGRSGFSVDYLPLPRAEWRTFAQPASLSATALIREDGCAVFAAYENEQLIGTCSVRNTASGWCDVLDIRVDAQFRRTGAAGMMLDAAENFAAGKGMSGMRVVAAEDNPALCQFCQHTGFMLQGIDRYALLYTAHEKEKPLSARSCAMIFYRTFQSKK